MNPFQPWATLKAALADRPTPSPGDKHGCDLEPGSGKCDSDSSKLMSFSSTCFYYGISLSEELEMSTGAPPPPIGMVHTSFGGSSIEQWLTNETIAKCANASIGPTNQVCVCVCVFVCAPRLPLLPLLPFTAATGCCWRWRCCCSRWRCWRCYPPALLAQRVAASRSRSLLLAC
eukprot:COSAG06_NODE_631_length_13616_cov_6.997411_2_plen_174_part_00